MSLEISVIVPVYNGEKTIANCIEALFSSKGARYEIIVVDDCSTDNTRDIVSRYPVTLITLPQRMGGGAARNPGAKRARAPILLHTDADVEVAPDTLCKILAEFEKDSMIDALFGAYSQTCPQSNFLSRYKNLHHHHVHQISRKRTNTFWSGCGAVRKEVFQAVGGFRNMYFLYDIDFGYRLDKAGFHIALAPQIQVQHHKYYSLSGLIRSDLLGRAIPWTRIMWEHNRFDNDLNTRKADTASAILVCTALGSLFLPIPITIKAMSCLGGLLTSSVVHRDWLICSYRYGGWSFALRATVMEWVYYAICGIGAFVGTGLFLKNRLYRIVKDRNSS